MSDSALDDEAGESQGAEAAAPPQKSSKMKLVILIAAPLLLFGIGGVAALYFLHIGPFAPKEDAAAAKEAPKPVAKPTAFLELPEILVNLASTGRKTSFLKLAVQLEVESPEDANKVKAVLPRLIDSFQVYLREMRVEDLKGSAGMYRLREELLGRVNAAAAPVKVSDILFKEMLVQ
jgi:flagellar protein FliL